MTIAAFVFASLPLDALAQSGGWSEPIVAPPEPEPPPPRPPPTLAPPPPPPAEPAPPASTAEPNPDWADPPPTEFEERSPQNPDWVEETEPPPVGNMPRRASESYGLRYANRDLVLPRGMMRGTYDTVVGRRPDQNGVLDDPFGPTGTISTMNFGVSISLAQDFEIGFSRYRMGSFPTISLFPTLGFGGEGLITFSMSPEVKFGDIPFYGRFQVLDRRVAKLAFDAVFRIPSSTAFGFLLGIPMRFIIQERFAFDTALEMTFDENPQGPNVWSLNIPLKFVANVTDRFFLEAGSGMTFFDLSQTVRTLTSGLVQGPFYFIPVGVRAGYTFEARATMMDAFVSFRFPELYGFTTRASEVNAQIWTVTIGFNVHSPVLFKGSAL